MRKAERRVALIFNRLKNTLQSKGLKSMETVGNDFDPDLHESTEAPAPSKDLVGKVIDEIVKGYYRTMIKSIHTKVEVGK